MIYCPNDPSNPTKHCNKCLWWQHELHVERGVQIPSVVLTVTPDPKSISNVPLFVWFATASESPTKDKTYTEISHDVSDML